MKKLILHIGTWKTGTTTIQNYLFNNSEELAKQGIIYSNSCSNNTFLIHFFHSNNDNHVTVRNSSKGQNELFTNAKDEITKLIKTTNNSKTLILSSEFLLDLSVSDIYGLKYYFKEYFDEIKVIAYIRHPALHASSAVNEQVKQGHYNIKTAFKYHSKPDEINRVFRWVEVFGKESIKIIPFEKKSLKSGDLLTDFRFYCNIKSNDNDSNTKNIDNTTLSEAAMLIADSLSEIAPSGSCDRGPSEYLNKISGPKYTADTYFLEEVVENTKVQLELLEKNFGIKLAGNIQDKVKINEVWTKDTITSIAKILNDLSLINSRLKSENKSLRADLTTLTNSTDRNKNQNKDQKELCGYSGEFGHSVDSFTE
ncbi:hypothetical protein [Endozoicomonas sp. SESOKO2]|uniref:hypothetical protein n=1 Tax=Endozoicomonas sp. SESOKO2 TaxID=2828743 RepID=UPI0021488F46|nr:hypothetical protein [Endozoicomonas sp. SESOKO2]